MLTVPHLIIALLPVNCVNNNNNNNNNNSNNNNNNNNNNINNNSAEHNFFGELIYLLFYIFLKIIFPQ